MKNPPEEKTGFIDIWSVLNDIYKGFRITLKEQNIAYEGMIFRELAENKSDDSIQESNGIKFILSASMP